MYYTKYFIAFLLAVNLNERTRSGMLVPDTILIKKGKMNLKLLVITRYYPFPLFSYIFFLTES